MQLAKTPKANIVVKNNVMRSHLFRSLVYLQVLTILLFVNPAYSQSDADFDKSSQTNAEMKAFITSSTYGVLAGALVGAATLAFTENPSDHLRNVAKGASLGLYAGILLGVYVVYLVPGQVEEQRRREEEQLGVKNFHFAPDITVADSGDATVSFTSLFRF